MRGQFEGEDRALADLAGHLERAAHGLHQALADGQAQARAAKLSGRGLVGLGEGAEQAIDLVRRDADAGVMHGDAQAVLARRRHLHHHPADLRELDGVVDQGAHHLAQAHGVARDQRRRRRVDVGR